MHFLALVTLIPNLPFFPHFTKFFVICNNFVSMYLPFIIKIVIFSDQIWSNLSKMDQTWTNWSSHQSKNVTIKSCLIKHDDKNYHYIFDQIGSELSKTDKTWSKNRPWPRAYISLFFISFILNCSYFFWTSFILIKLLSFHLNFFCFF